MDHAAVLSVLVKAEGLAETAAKVKALDAELAKAGAAADGAGGSFQGASKDAKALASDFEKARAAASGLGSETGKAARDVQKLGGETDNTSRKVGGLAGGMTKATRATDLWRDAQGRWRNSAGQFATDAEKLAAGIDDIDGSSRRGAGGIGTLNSAVSALGGGFGGLSSALVFATPLMLALSGAAFAVGAALAPLVGLAGAAAVGLSALGQAAGVVGLASLGVSDALKEQMDATGKAAKAATTGADQQKAAAQAIASAQESVHSAKERVRTASEELTAAMRGEQTATQNLAAARNAEAVALSGMQAAEAAGRREVQDSTVALQHAYSNEKGAILALADAKRQLDALMQPADALSVADAQDAVADAARGQTQATINLTKAQQALDAVNANPAATDLEKAQAALDLADAQNAVGDATRNSAHAQKQLADLTAGPDPLEVAKAQQNVADAQQGVTDATRDRARQEIDTQAVVNAGVAGSQAVVAAQAKITQAHQQVTQAQRALRDSYGQAADAQHNLDEASRGVTHALQAVKAAQDNAKTSAAGATSASTDLNAKFNALPPAAQAFVRVLQGLKPKLDDLRATAASGLFPGVIAGINAAMGAFNPLKKVVGETATTLGGLATRAGELVGSSAFGKDIETVGKSNTTIIDRVGRAAIYAADTLRHIIVAAGPLTRWLATITLHWAKNADGATKAARESGKLGDFFDKTRSVLKTVGSILGNLATAFFNVGKAAAPFGGNILKSIDKVTAKFSEWTKSVGGQHALQDFFRQSTQLAAKLMPALGGALGSLGSMAFKVMPAYIRVLQLLGPAAGPALQAFIAFKLALTGLAVVSGVVGGITAVTRAFGLLTTGTKFATVAQKENAAAAFIAKGVQLAVAAATKAWTAAQWLLNVALDANPIGLAVIAIAALIAGVILAYKHIDVFRDAVNTAWEAIKTGAVAAFNWLKDNWPLILAILAGPFGLAVLEIVKHWTAIKNAATDGTQKIIDAIKSFGTKLVALGSWIVDQIVTGFKTVTGALTSVGGWLKDQVVGIVHAVASGFTGLGGWVLDHIVGGITTVTTGVSKIGSWLKGVIGDALNAAKDGIVGLGGTVIGWIVDGLEAGANLLVKFVNKIIGLVNKLPGVDIKPIKEFAQGGVHGATADNVRAAGFARGGAFARTNGVVNQPMTFMGEEAPRHPEFIIPTNPAYRGRARALLAQAAGAIGLARGGIYSQQQIVDLWKAQGGNPAKASDMSWVAMAESHGDAGINYGGGHFSPLGQAGKLASGLYQILGLPFPGDVYDAAVNTRMAISKSSNGQNLHPWDASRGVWGSHIGGGGILGAIGHAVSGAAGTVTGLLADGGKALLGALPSADGLGWLSGLGSYAIDHVKDWITGKVGGLLGGGGGSSSGPDGVGSFGGVQMANWVVEALKYAQRKLGYALHPTSGFRPGFDSHTTSGTSEHQGTQYPHGAVDFGGYHDAAALAMKNAVVQATRDFKWPLLAPVGFVDDGHASGTGHKMGGMWGGVLGSYAAGTNYVPETGPYLLHQGERVTPKGQNNGPLVHIEHAEFKSEEDSVRFAREFAWRLAT